MEEKEPTTEELRIAQLQEERDQREQADRSRGDEKTKRHSRRAEKAAYLREKLDERAASERAAEEGAPDEPNADEPEED